MKRLMRNLADESLDKCIFKNVFNNIITVYIFSLIGLFFHKKIVILNPSNFV